MRDAAPPHPADDDGRHGADGEPALTIACLCAAWCRTCDAYADTLRQVRDALAAAAPGAPLRVLLIDIEDEADRLGDLDVENFPTVLIARGGSLLFFGTVTPHAQTLERLARGALDGSLAPLAAPPAPALALLPLLAGLPAL